MTDNNTGNNNARSPESVRSALHVVDGDLSYPPGHPRRYSGSDPLSEKKSAELYDRIVPTIYDAEWDPA